MARARALACGRKTRVGSPIETLAARTQKGLSGDAICQVYRKASEKDDPRFHEGKKGVYKQGRRVGIFGILADGKLTYAWFDEAKCDGKGFAKLMRQRGAGWGVDKGLLALDGEKALHTKEAAAAVRGCGFAVEQLPANSPDLNPIENAWALLDERVAETDPGALEMRS